MAIIRQFNYWSHAKPVATFLAAAVTARFFDDGVANVTTALGNNNELLASAGALPDNREGALTGVFCSIRNMGPVWTEAASKLAVELINNSRIVIYIAGGEVQRGPVWAFCRPPEWAFGTTGAASGLVQNGGYLLQTATHPILSLQTIRVDWILDQAPTATMTTLAPTVTVQTFDAKRQGGS